VPVDLPDSGLPDSGLLDSGLLQIQDVSVRFGGVTALDGVSLTARSGRVTGLIGPNGAGKTTLFNVISGMQPIARGAVRFDGRNLGRVSPSGRSRAGIGRTFQRLEAFGSLTVRENVLVAVEIRCGLGGLGGLNGLSGRQGPGGPGARRGRRGRGVLQWMSAEAQRAEADRLLELVGIGEYAQRRADAVPTGVARLLEVARSLATGPRLLLLDEPSSGLVETETERFGGLLRSLAGDGRAIVMVEHDLGLVMSTCDYVYVLDFGRVIAAGTPAEIHADPVVQQAYLGTLEVS
jgi:branched-chain amino acid transport system ATP-binding protein